MNRNIAILLSLTLGAPALAATFDLSQYHHVATFALPSPAADEASAIAWNWDTDTLFVLGDEGDAIAEVTRTGALVGTMTLTGFADTEGLTYIGGGQFVLVEERLQDAFRFTYTQGASVSSAGLVTASLGPTVGNIGLEGLAFERSSGEYFLVKEKTPQAVYQAAIDFTLANVTPTSLFTPALGVLDLSDIAVLSNVASLVGTTDEGNLLILSQESSMLLEVSRTGAILSQFSLAGLASDIEGVTIADDGTIYVCSEAPQVFVLIPAPGCAALGALTLGAFGVFGARQRR